MKNLIVQKFGGSSLATPEQILSVAKKVSELYHAGKKLILVTSAMGKTTDQLTQLAYQISPRPQRRELDMLLTTGERVSMALMAMALSDLGCPAISFTGSQAGILTDGDFSNATITELRPHRVEQALNENKIVVLAGFQGVDPVTKEVTTLGRGGSDTTAVAMAAHFKADRCEILKDVSGVYSYDPNLQAGAKLYEKLPMDVLYEFCFWGAKVLNYKSVGWAQKYQVPLFIGRADDFSIGTEVAFDSNKNFMKNAKGEPLAQGEFLGVHSHRHVLEVEMLLKEKDSELSLAELFVESTRPTETLVATSTPDVNAQPSEHANLFSTSLKKFAIPPVQILAENKTDDYWRGLITSDADIIEGIRRESRLPIGILRDRISTVTVSRAQMAPENFIVSANDREKKIRELIKSN